MYFSASLPSDRMSTSITSLYDISPLSQSTSQSDDYSTATCAYPSWPRRPSLHTSSSASSSRSSSPVTFSRRPSPEIINAWISDEDLFPEAFAPQQGQQQQQRRHMTNPLAANPYQGGVSMVRDSELPMSSPVGSMPREGAASGNTLSSMSPRELAQRMRVMEARRVAAAIAVAKEQARESRRRRASAEGGKRRSV